MSICLLLILLVYDHATYDNFHPKGDRTFRIISHEIGSESIIGESGFATSPLNFKESLDDKYHWIESFCTMTQAYSGEIKSEEKIIEVRDVLFTDKAFFETFGFELEKGDPKTALTNSFSVVLSPETAQKLFPDEDAMGKSIEFTDQGTFIVTGIIKEIPNKSQIQTEVFASKSTLAILEKKELITARYQEWDNIYSNYNYLVLKDESYKSELEEILTSVGEENIQLEDEDEAGFYFELQNIENVVLGPLRSNEIGFFLPKISILFLAMLGIIVIITASLNFANLSISQNLSRIREVGVRKTIGASRSQIILQFLIESVMISLLALLVALSFYRILIDQFNALWIFTFTNVRLLDVFAAYWYFLAFSLFLGIITGIGPAFFMSKRNIIKSLKGINFIGVPHKNPIMRHFSARKLMMGIQFGLTIILMISIFLLKDQSRLFKEAEYGMEEEAVYYLDLQGHDKEILANEFSKIPGVKNVSFTSHHPSTGRSRVNEYFHENDSNGTSISYFAIDENYIDVLGLELIAGTNFPKQGANNEELLVLNEKAVQNLGYENASEAVGNFVIAKSRTDETRLKIVGVVKDYHWEPMIKDISSLALRVIPEDHEHVYFKLETSDMAGLNKNMREKWAEFDSEREFKGGFLDDKMREFYNFFYDLGDILSLVSIVSLAITAMGFLGMISFHLKTHVKEFGIRKILGANFRELAIGMSKGYIWMFGISLLIAIPAAIFINGLWLNSMAVRVELGFNNLVPAVLSIIAIVGISILSQVWKTEKSNPVDALRNE